MALLLLKQLVLPNKSTTQSYTTLKDRSSSDLEALSASSTCSSDSPFLSEKPASYTTSSSTSTNQLRARIISDATIGLSDGLTVPFALTAGLSALGQSKFVVYGGLAELIAGSISMGLGGYLGARSEADGYRATLSETQDVARNRPIEAAGMAREAFADFDFPQDLLDRMCEHLNASNTGMAEFLMRFHHMQQDTSFSPSRAYASAATIAAGYFFGGFVPLVPYFFFSTVQMAFEASVALMVIALFAFGFAKTRLVGEQRAGACCYAGLQMVVLGGLAAGAAMAMVLVLAR